MDRGLSRVRSTSLSLAGTTTPTVKEGTTLSPVLFIGVPILLMMVGGGPMSSETHSIPPSPRSPTLLVWSGARSTSSHTLIHAYCKFYTATLIHPFGSVDNSLCPIPMVPVCRILGVRLATTLLHSTTTSTLSSTWLLEAPMAGSKTENRASLGSISHLRLPKISTRLKTNGIRHGRRRAQAR